MKQLASLSPTQILSTLFCIFILALIRFYEETLFYDPLLNYFKTNFQGSPLPPMNRFLLLTSYTFRYLLNSFLSLVIIYLCLQNRTTIRVSALMYLILLLILLGLFAAALYGFTTPDKMFLFYVRRLITQPIFLLLFLAGFLYQNNNKTPKKQNI